jgi:hypothetical protein
MSSQITQACNEEAEAYLAAVIEFRQSIAKDLHKSKSQSSAQRAVISHPIDLSPTSPADTEPDEAPSAAVPLAAQPALAPATNAGASDRVCRLQASAAASANGPSLGAEAAPPCPAFKIAEDGSLQVINKESAQENVTLLCEIRRKIVEKYLTLHETGEWRRLAGGISANDFKTYELPGTAVEECHKLLRERLMPLLQSGYRQGAAKRQFKPRSA